MKKSEIFWSSLFIIFLITIIVIVISTDNFNVGLSVIFGIYIWLCINDALSALTFNMMKDWNFIYIVGNLVKKFNQFLNK